MNGTLEPRNGIQSMRMVSHNRLPALGFLSVLACSIPAAGQTTDQTTVNEFRPELGIYVQEGPIFRFEFIDSPRMDWTTNDWQGSFTVFVQAALKPVFRPELGNNPDVYRNKYLTFRAGYRYVTGLTSGDVTSENRGIIELTPRYLLPWQFVIIDRNRGELRFVKGRQFSTRYRNRLRLERDVTIGRLLVTPFVYDEIFYDSRLDRWTPNLYAIGFDLPVGRRILLEPYYLRQNGGSSNPTHINALGFTFNIYF